MLAHIKGVIDPTGKIPENKVFISGYVPHNGCREPFGKAHKTVYLSRSPCLEPGDAKLVDVLGSKAKGMTSSDWSMLCGYEFGTLVFPRPRDSRSKHLACMIAGEEIFSLVEIRFNPVRSHFHLLLFILITKMETWMETVRITPVLFAIFTRFLPCLHYFVL